MSELLLRLLEDRVAPARVVLASRAKGGEYHSPCPLCGGRDRFLVFPEQPGGALCRKHGLNGTWSCPRHCGKGGDLISFLMAVDGLDFAEACAALGIRLDEKYRRDGRARHKGYRPLHRPGAAAATGFAPRVWSFPPKLWRRQATALAATACANPRAQPLGPGLAGSPRSAPQCRSEIRPGLDQGGKYAPGLHLSQSRGLRPAPENGSSGKEHPCPAHSVRHCHPGLGRGRPLSAPAHPATGRGHQPGDGPCAQVFAPAPTGRALFRAVAAAACGAQSGSGRLAGSGGGTGRPGRALGLRRPRGRALGAERAWQAGSSRARGSGQSRAHSGGPGLRSGQAGWGQSRAPRPGPGGKRTTRAPGSGPCLRAKIPARPLRWE